MPYSRQQRRRRLVEKCQRSPSGKLAVIAIVTQSVGLPNTELPLFPVYSVLCSSVCWYTLCFETGSSPLQLRCFCPYLLTQTKRMNQTSSLTDCWDDCSLTHKDDGDNQTGADNIIPMLPPLRHNNRKTLMKKSWRFTRKIKTERAAGPYCCEDGAPVKWMQINLCLLHVADLTYFQKRQRLF